MEPVPGAADSNELHSFLEFLYGGLEGVAYVATKDPAISDPLLAWSQTFFQMPADFSRVESVILQATSTHEVYVSPVLFSKPSGKKEDFKVSNVVWTEFDGNAPNESDYENLPSLRIQSSSEGNQHVYWRLTEPLSDRDKLEQINKNITYSMEADFSAWDANQVLRPPGTINHKRGAPVHVFHNSDTSYDVNIFNALPPAPSGPDESKWQLGVIPDVQDVILKYPFPPDAIALLKKTKDDVSDGSGQRAKSLVNLAYTCCQMGLSDAEVFVVLKLADERWGKFKDRSDRNKRLAHIITVARNKYPEQEQAGNNLFAYAMDFETFLDTEIEIDWVIGEGEHGMLMEQGTMLMAGPSGIGKTQISLQFMIHIALGRDYWHYKINKPRKILFLSLEMGHGALKKVVEQMAKTLQPDDLALLRENFIVVPHGEKWALNTPVGQEHLLRMIEDIEPNGVFIDSIGSAIQGSISDDETVMAMLDFNDRIVKKYDLFTWYIHHMRKSTNGGGAPSSQDDVYGNQFLVNRSSSTYLILRGRDGLIKIRNAKQRLAEQEGDYFVKRGEHLAYTKLNQEVDQAVQHVVYKKPEELKGPGDDGVQHGNFTL